MSRVSPEPVSILEAMKDPAVRVDPYPFYAHLREMGAMVPTVFDTWIATRHEEVFTLLRDARFSSNAKHAANYPMMSDLAKQVGLGDILDLAIRIMLFADPPDHTRIRRISSKAFTMRAVERMRPRIAAIVDKMLDDVEPDGGTELIEALAFPLPVTVISDMLGVPAADHPQLREWTGHAVKALDPSDDIMGLFPAVEALRDMRAYFNDLAEERKRNPGEDLLSALIAAEDEGDRLTRDELLDTTILLFGAGHETTVNLISGGTLNLLRHPSELSRLQSDPTLIESAVEELLRFGPPVQFTSRTATVDIELGGEPIPQGTEVIALIAGANRDSSVFSRPDVLDVGRPDNRHLAFGGGIHHCLGAPLARVEGQEAIGRLFARFPKLALENETVDWKTSTTIRGPARLPLVW